jgi:hypothetical protein
MGLQPFARLAASEGEVGHVDVRGLRVSMGPEGQSEFGRQIGPRWWLLARQLDDGWLLVAADGSVYRSERFAGALTRVGVVSEPAFDGVLQRAPTIVLGRRGSASLISERGEVTPIRAPDGESIIDASTDGDAMYVIATPGRVYRSTDSGASLQPYRSFRGAPLELEGKRLFASDGEYEIGEDGSMRRLGPAPERERTHSPMVRSERLRAEIPGMDWSADKLLEDGSRLLRTEHGVAVVGRGQRRLLPSFEPHDCSVLPWGDGVVGECRVDDLEHVQSEFVRTEAGDAITLAIAPRDGNATLLTSRDGKTLVWPGPCKGGLVGRGGGLYCWFDGTTWTEFVLEDELLPVALVGSTLLLGHLPERRDDQIGGWLPHSLRGADDLGQWDASEPTRYSFVRLGPRAPTPVAIASELPVIHADLLADGRLVIHVAKPDPQGILELDHTRIGFPGQANWVSVPSPDGRLVRVAFADASRAIAVEISVPERDESGVSWFWSGRAWQLDPSARTWQPLELPVRGDARSLWLRSSPQCVRSLCWFGSFVWGEAALIDAEGLGEFEFVAHDDLAPTSPLEPAPVSFATTVSSPVRWRCTTQDADFGSNSFGWLEITDVVGGYAWAAGGVDERGGFSLRPRKRSAVWRDYPSWEPLVEGPAEDGLIPLVTRDLALTYASEAYWILTAARAQVLEIGDGHHSLDDALPLAGGKLALLFRDEAQVVLTLDRSGSIVERRDFAIEATARLALGPSGPGLATLTDAGELRFYGLDPDAEVVRTQLTWLDELEALEPCASAPAPDSMLVSWPVDPGIEFFWERAVPTRATRPSAILEVRPDRACVQALRSELPFHLHADNRRYIGWTTNEQPFPVDCTEG